MVFATSIRARLTWLCVIASSAALLIACTAFLVFELVTFPRAMVHNLATHAQVIAANATADLLFDDSSSANITLAALQADPHIVSVEIRTANDRPFALYRRSDDAPAPAASLAKGVEYAFSGDHLTLAQPILSRGTVVGQVSLVSDLGERNQRISRFLVISMVILAGSLIGALLVASRLQRRITQPILDLAEATRQVSAQKTYAVRVKAPSRDEVGRLAESFNHMLEEIEQRDAELRQAVEARDEFLSIASHELKTPLTPLQLQVQKMQEVAYRRAEEPQLDRLVRGLEMADRQVGRLTSLVNNLLDISRITSHRLQLEREPLDLVSVVREVLNRHQPELLRVSCPVTFHGREPVPGLWDRTRLEQVVSNFLSNAIKYGAGRPIEIWVDSAKGQARFRIRDHGIGIAPADQARIFERFERAVSAHNYGGFGLGLWIVRQIVDALGGHIEVDSAPGAGATFTVALPLGVPDHHDVVASENGLGLPS